MGGAAPPADAPANADSVPRSVFARKRRSPAGRSSPKASSSPDDREQAGCQYDSGAPTPCRLGPDPVEACRGPGENGKEKRQRDAEAVSVEQAVRKRDKQGGSAQLGRQPPDLWTRVGSQSVVFKGSGRHGCRSRLETPSAAAASRAGKARISVQAFGTMLSCHQPSLASRCGNRDEKDFGARMCAIDARADGSDFAEFGRASGFSCSFCADAGDRNSDPIDDCLRRYPSKMSMPFLMAIIPWESCAADCGSARKQHGSCPVWSA